MPPFRKIWQTVGSPQMLIIASYRLGFDLTPCGPASVLRIFIYYALPETGVARWCGLLLGRSYARWCVHRMLSDAVKHFERTLRETTSGAISSDA